MTQVGAQSDAGYNAAQDRSLSADIERVADAVRSGAIVAAAEAQVGALA